MIGDLSIWDIMPDCGMEMKSLALTHNYVPGKFQVTLSSLVVRWFAFCFHYLFLDSESKHISKGSACRYTESCHLLLPPFPLPLFFPLGRRRLSTRFLPSQGGPFLVVGSEYEADLSDSAGVKLY